MNLIEAVKSGKPFKRPTWDDIQFTTYVPFDLSKEDVLAEDYILKEPQPKLVTWYRAKIIWSFSRSAYREVIVWGKSKDDVINLVQEVYGDAKVIEWEERELPEEWKE